MKARAIALLGMVGVPLLVCQTTPAGFTGLSVESKPNRFGIFVCNLYAEFDRPGEDQMLAVFGSPDMPAFISVIGGEFYQSLFGTNTPPNPLFFEVFPTTRYDTFVTIGVKSFNPADPGNPEGEPEDDLILSAGFPRFEPSLLDLTFGFFGGGAAWAVTPDAGQGDPFNPNFSTGGDGRVLIAQLATVDGVGFEGTLGLQFVSNGVTEVTVVSFSHVPAPGAAILLAAIVLRNPSRRRRRGVDG